MVNGSACGDRVVVTVERRGASVEGDAEGGGNLEERIVIEADRADGSVEERKVKQGKGMWWTV